MNESIDYEAHRFLPWLMASVRALNAGLESRRLHIGMLPSPISLPSHTKFLCALDVALLELQQLQRITLQMQHLC
jgi:hypothetical protein